AEHAGSLRQRASGSSEIAQPIHTRCRLPAACCLVPERWDKSMVVSLRSSVAAAALAFAGATGAGAARADEVADFYRGKTITVVVAHEAGTGFDVYARAFARYFARHVPGNPTMIVQNMPGAGGITGAAWLYNIAPKDGTTIATIVHAVMLDHQ